MRYYLDTNIVVFLLIDNDNISKDVFEIINDYDNIFYISTVVAKEIVHLHKRGVIKESRFKTSKDVLKAIERTGIIIKPLNECHIQKYAEINIPVEKHNDPNDHVIIAQAIAERIPVISSDRKFELYASQGLKFIYNQK